MGWCRRISYGLGGGVSVGVVTELGEHPGAEHGLPGWRQDHSAAGAAKMVIDLLGQGSDLSGERGDQLYLCADNRRVGVLHDVVLPQRGGTQRLL